MKARAIAPSELRPPPSIVPVTPLRRDELGGLYERVYPSGGRDAQDSLVEGRGVDNTFIFIEKSAAKEGLAREAVS